jgi:hypothetical protein
MSAGPATPSPLKMWIGPQTSVRALHERDRAVSSKIDARTVFARFDADGSGAIDAKERRR